MPTRPKSIRADEALWERLQRVVDRRQVEGEKVNHVVVALIEEFVDGEEASLGLKPALDERSAAC